KRRHLRQGSLLALEADSHGSHCLLVLLIQLGQAGLTGDVRLAVESPAVFQGAVEHGVSVCVELHAKWLIEIELATVILTGLERRLNSPDEPEVRRLPF